MLCSDRGMVANCDNTKTRADLRERHAVHDEDKVAEVPEPVAACICILCGCWPKRWRERKRSAWRGSSCWAGRGQGKERDNGGEGQEGVKDAGNKRETEAGCHKDYDEDEDEDEDEDDGSERWLRYNDVYSALQERRRVGCDWSFLDRIIPAPTYNYIDQSLW